MPDSSGVRRPEKDLTVTETDFDFDVCFGFGNVTPRHCQQSFARLPSFKQHDRLLLLGSEQKSTDLLQS